MNNDYENCNLFFFQNHVQTAETPGVIYENELLKFGNRHKILMTDKDEKAGFEMQSSKNDSGAVYESLTKTQQDKSLFRRMVYLMGFLLVLIFLITVVNLALNWSQLKSSSGMSPLV